MLSSAPIQFLYSLKNEGNVWMSYPFAAFLIRTTNCSSHLWNFLINFGVFAPLTKCCSRESVAPSLSWEACSFLCCFWGKIWASSWRCWMLVSSASCCQSNLLWTVWSHWAHRLVTEQAGLAYSTISLMIAVSFVCPQSVPIMTLRTLREFFPLLVDCLPCLVKVSFGWLSASRCFLLLPHCLLIIKFGSHSILR